jgi:class 3 adenylate cyclase
MAEWPSGTVTFLFTDLEGSTQRWQQYPAAMGPALARHDRLLREAISAHGGVVFKTVGDAVCAAFATAPAAVAAALTAQRALYAEPWGSTPPLRVRMALHTGQAEVQEGDYFGGPLNRVARLLALGHGGQVLLSGPTADLVQDYLPPGARLEDLGTHRLKDVQRPEHVFQLVVPDLPWEFGPLTSGGQEPVAAAPSSQTPPAVPAAAAEGGNWLRPRVTAAALALVAVAAIAGVLATQLGSDDDSRGPQPPPAANVPAAEPRPSATVTLTAAPETATATVAAMTTAIMTPVSAAVASPDAAAVGNGSVVYMVSPDQPGAGRIFRIAAEAGAEPVDLSAALDALAPDGREDWVAASPDGAWLLFATERFDPECAGWPCLAVAPADLSSAELVRVDGAIVHAELGAIAGDAVVVPSDEGPHQVDLWAIRRVAGGWGARVLLTGDSPYAFHAAPSFSFDGARVVFECGDRQYGELGTALCDVGVDGTGFQVVLEPSRAPDGMPASAALRQPAYAPDGGLVFEATWDDRVWRLPPGGAVPERVGPSFANDLAPCVLSDGRVASLWLGGATSEGRRELKVMTADGADHLLLVTGVDIALVDCAG